MTAIDNSNFLSATNVQQILSGAAIIALLAISETIVIITRNVGSPSARCSASPRTPPGCSTCTIRVALPFVFLFALGVGVVCRVVGGAL